MAARIRLEPPEPVATTTQSGSRTRVGAIIELICSPRAQRYMIPVPGLSRHNPHHYLWSWPQQLPSGPLQFGDYRVIDITALMQHFYCRIRGLLVAHCNNFSIWHNDRFPPSHSDPIRLSEINFRYGSPAVEPQVVKSTGSPLVLHHNNSVGIT